MYHLRLIKASSYSGIVTATRKNPDVFVEDQATADKVVATGYFQLIEGDGEVTDNGEETPAEKALKDMSMAELETYAAYHDISLKGTRSKAVAIAKIEDAMGAENGVDYGSPTMQELQGEV